MLFLAEVVSLCKAAKHERYALIITSLAGYPIQILHSSLDHSCFYMLVINRKDFFLMYHVCRCTVYMKN